MVFGLAAYQGKRDGRQEMAVLIRSIEQGGKFNRVITDDDRRLNAKKNARFEREMFKQLAGADFA